MKRKEIIPVGTRIIKFFDDAKFAVYDNADGYLLITADDMYNRQNKYVEDCTEQPLFQGKNLAKICACTRNIHTSFDGKEIIIVKENDNQVMMTPSSGEIIHPDSNNEITLTFTIGSEVLEIIFYFVLQK